MAIVALVTLLSLDISSALVAAGYVAGAPFAIAAATNATPIVVTTSTPHGISAGQVAHAVIASVGGNTAANGTWIATALDATRFTLTTMGPDGTVANSQGNGAYTSGGTLAFAFTDGKALLGRQHVNEQSSPPRIVFVPLSSTFGPKSVASRSNVQGNMSAEQLQETQARSIATEKVRFEVHVWGQATQPDYDGDFDRTQILYQQVIRSSLLIATGVTIIGDGRWVEAQDDATQLMRAGRGFVFELELATPVLDKVLPLVQPGTTAGSNVYLNQVDAPHLAAGGI